MGRLSFATTEERLYKEFDDFGPVEHVTLILDKAGKPRGYAFVEFKHKRDADFAIIKGDNRKIDGRRILVDRELGRTKRGWFPRRLGGGKGNSRRDAVHENLVKDLTRDLEAEELAEFNRLNAKPEDDKLRKEDPDYESGQDSEEGRADRKYHRSRTSRHKDPKEKRDKKRRSRSRSRSHSSGCDERDREADKKKQ